MDKQTTRETMNSYLKIGEQTVSSTTYKAANVYGVVASTA